MKKIKVISALLLAIFVLFMASCSGEQVHFHCFIEGTCECGDLEANHPEVPSVKIVFKDDMGNEVLTKDVKLGTLIPEVADLEKEGHTFIGWHYNDVLWMFDKTPVVEEMELVAKFTTNEYYNIIFDLDGGEFTSDVEIPEQYQSGVGLAKLPKPVKENHIFLGWYLDGKFVKEISKIAVGEITLKARWEESKHTITYDLAGGNFENAKEVVYLYNQGEGLEKLPVAVKEHYEFLGWTLNGEYITSIAKEQVGSVNLVANWELSKYEIKYELDGGVLENAPTSYTYQDEIKFALPHKEGYKFLGWYVNDELTEGIKKGSSGEVVVTAKWEYIIVIVNSEIEFDLNGGKVDVELPKTYIEGEGLASLPVPTKEQAIFLGWYLDGKLVEKVSAEQTGKIVLVAKWKEIIKSKVEFDLQEGKFEEGVEIPSIYTEEEGLATLPTPSKAGYNFLGWYLNDKLVTSISKEQKGDVVLVASFEAIKYTIKFELGLFGSIASVEYTIEDEVLLPTYEVEGFKFLGWFLGDVAVEKVEKGTTGDLVIEAKYEKIPDVISKIIYDLAGGHFEGEYVDTYVEKQGLKTLPKPVKEGYNFLGWYTDDNKILLTISADARGDINLKASWSPIRYTITYKGIEGAENVSSNDKFTAEMEFVLPIPTKPSHIFLGWYLEDQLIEKVEKGTTHDIEVVAKWEEIITSEIEYVLDGGLLPEDVNYTYIEGEGLASLPTPEKLGYAFVGWFIDDVKVESITTEQTGKVVLTAKWEEVELSYDIKYELDGGKLSGDYKTKQDLIDDLMSDFNKYLRAKAESEGKEYTDIVLPEQISTSDPFYTTLNWSLASNLDYAPTFLNDNQMNAKWGWLFEYIDSFCSPSLLNPNNTVTSPGIWTYTVWGYLTASPAKSGWPSIRGDFSNETELPSTYKNKVVYEYKYKEEVILPSASKDGYVFIGWLLGDKLVDRLEAGTFGDVVLTAKYGVKYTAKLYHYSGITENFDCVSGLEWVLPEATREGYNFLGWYNEAGEKVEVLPAEQDSDLELTAKWEIITYKINYSGIEGAVTENSEELLYEYNADNFEYYYFPQLVKPGYNFLGWRINGGEITYSPSAYIGGEIETNAVACWSLIQYSAEFDTYRGSVDVSAEDIKKAFEFSHAMQITKVTNNGNTRGFYVANKDIMNGWSLAFQAKILIKYNEDLDAYKVVAVAGEKVTIQDMDAEVNSNWDYVIAFHSLPQEDPNFGKHDYTIKAITQNYQVGQYLRFTQELTIGNENIIGMVYNTKEDIFGDVYTVFFNVENLITELPVPTREYFKFLGWYNEAGEKVEKIKKLENIKLIAKWEITDEIEFVESSISYNTNDGYFPEGTVLVDKYLEKIGAYDLPIPVREYYNFEGWMLNGEVVERVYGDVTGDIELVAKWSPVEFNINLQGAVDATFGEGEVIPSTYTVESEDIILYAPSKVGYNFLGWFNGEEEVKVISKGSVGDYTFVAKWELVEYTITYEGLETEVKEYTHEEIVALFLEDVSTFSGVTITLPQEYWMSAGYITFWQDAQMHDKWAWIVEYLIVLAQEQGVDTYYLDLLLNDVSALSNWTIRYAIQNVQLFLVQTNYDGWRVNYEPQYGNLTSTLRAIDCTNVTCDSYKAYLPEELVGLPQTYTVLDEIVLSEQEKFSYTFVGWYLNDQLIEKIEKGTTGNITLVAKWEEIKEFSITYHNCSELPLDAPYSYSRGEGLESLPAQAKEGYIFLGWYLNDELVESISKEQLGDIDLYAKWEVIEYTITYEGVNNVVGPTNHQEVVAEFIKDFNNFSGEEITAPEQYWSSGSKTIFWKNAEMHAKWSWIFKFLSPLANSQGQSTQYLENMYAEPASISSYATQNVAIFLLQANATIWNEQYKAVGGALSSKWTTVDCTAVTYEAYAEYLTIGGTLNPETYTVDDTIVLVSPVKEGYVFLGWYNNDVKVESIEKGTTGNITLVAKWQEVQEIEYILDGGILPEGTNSYYIEGEGLATLPTPTKEHYTFLGWYLNGKIKVNSISKSQSGKVSLTAKWEQNSHAIQYELDGGVLPEDAPKSYLEGNGLFTLPTPTKDGYRFVYWYVSNSDVAYEYIPEYQVGEVTLYAKWIEISDEDVLEVGPDAKYKTIADALLAAKEGATIKVAAGNYLEVIEINVKGITLEGPNADINPNTGSRVSEAIFENDIVVSADDVTINGIYLTNNGRIAGSANGIANLTIKNVEVENSTVNPNADSFNAPLYFMTQLESAIFKNLVIMNMKYSGSYGRPMILMGCQIEDLKITNSVFELTSNNYNDGIKIHTEANNEYTFGLRGNVEISNNYFAGFMQYPIWIQYYGQGDYQITNNEFVNCGVTASSHTIVRFENYVGQETDKLNISVTHNTSNNSYSLFRMGANINLPVENVSIKVNYNKSLNNSAIYFINNKSSYVIDATNNYYDVIPAEYQFLNATWDPYYANEEDVPNPTLDENTIKIEYELNGGYFENYASKYYNKLEGLYQLLVPTKDYSTFIGWYYNDQLVTSLEKGMNVDSIKLVAKWDDINEFNINYIIDGVLPEDTSYSYKRGEGLSSLPEPTKFGYTFLGWYSNGVKVDAIPTDSLGDRTLFGEWEITEYTLTYVSDRGIISKYNSVDDAIQDFLNDYNAFHGTNHTVETIDALNAWSQINYTSQLLYSEQYRAKWAWLIDYLASVATYNKRAFDAFNNYNSYSELSSANANYTYQITYEVRGWICQKQFTKNSNFMSADYSDSYISNAMYNYCANDKYIFTAFDGILELPQLVSRGYNFLGWFNEAGEEVKSFDSATASDITLYAKWEKGEDIYSEIEYVLDGGILPENAPMTYIEGEGLETLPIPFKEGYNFLGWYMGYELVESIKNNQIGKVTLTSSWAAINYVITYDLQGGSLGTPMYSTFDALGEDFLADFNKYGEATLTKDTFFGSSTAGIKKAFANAEMLAKWNWLFAYMKAHLIAINEGKLTDVYLADTLKCLDELMAGGSTIIAGGGDLGGPNARTMIRAYMAGVMNATKGTPNNATFSAYCPDFSVEANQIAIINGNPSGNTQTYTIEDEVELLVPTKEGYKFLGWYNEALEKVEKLEKGTTGDLTLVAKWEESVLVSSEIEYVLDGGTNAENAPATYVEGEGLATLPVPTKEGHEFLGWYLGEEKVESIKAEQTGKVTLTAKWEKVETPEPPVAGKVVYVGEGKDYATLDEAIKGVEAGTRIVLAAGEYSLSVVIDKSVIIEGPNANLTVAEFKKEEALINVAKDVSGNLAAKNIEFNGVHLKGTGGGAGIAGISFQDGGNIETLSFISCVLSDTNTLLKFVGGTSSLDLLMKDNHIHTIGQFVLWTTTSINKTTLVGNVVDGLTCGAVTNSAAALFRVRHGSLEAYNNVFNGDSQNIPGYFECSAEASVVKYNTFNNVTRYVHPTANNNIVFDENLYVTEGAVADKAPASLMGGGIVTPDAKVAKSAEEIEMLYINYLLTSDPSRYFEVEFDANGGLITSFCPSVYDSNTGIAKLPTIELAGSRFGGWYLNGAKVESVPAGTTGKIKLVAKWEETVLVSSEIEYILNDGVLPADAPTTYVEGEGLEKLPVPTKEGYVFLGWYNEAGEKVESITTEQTGKVVLTASWELYVEPTYTIEYELNGGYFLGGGTYSSMFGINQWWSDGLEFDGPIAMCDTTITSRNSLRWIYKALLKYDETLKAYEVVAVDGATSNAANLGVEWTHAIVSTSVQVNTYVSVGQYIVPQGTVGTEMSNVITYVYEKENIGPSYHTSFTKNDLPLELVSPVKEAASFCGWYLDENFETERIYSIPEGTTSNIKLYAKWETTKVDVTFNLDGGVLEGLSGAPSYEFISEDFLKDFNKYGNCELAAPSFAADSHPEVKTALSNLEMLTKWQWYFQFMLDDLKTIHGENPDIYVADTIAVLQKIVALDTNAINENANARTLIRFYTGGMLQKIKGSDGNPTFTDFCGDFSEVARQEALLKAAPAGNTITYETTSDVTLPVPTKEGYIFNGWYNETGEKVEVINFGVLGQMTLTAKWESEKPYVTNPQADVAYYLVLEQEYNNCFLFFTQNKEGLYFASTDTAEKATKVYLENVEGGFAIYVLSGETKHYLNVYMIETYVRCDLQETQTSVWTYNEEYETLVTTAGDRTWIIDTYSKYNEFRVSSIQYASTDFIARLYKVDKAPVNEPHEHIPCPICGLCTAEKCRGNESEICQLHYHEGTIAEVKAAAAKYIYDEKGVQRELVTNSSVVYRASVVAVVTAKLNASGYGQFMIHDGTEGIYVYSTLDGLEVGDKVSVSGEIYSYYGALQFGKNISVSIVEKGAGLDAEYRETTPQELETEAAERNDKGLVKAGYYGGELVNVSGYLETPMNTVNADVYQIKDAKTGDVIWIYWRSYSAETEEILKSYVGKYVTLRGVMYARDSRTNKCQILWDGTIVEAEAPELTDEEKANLALSELVVSSTAYTDFELTTGELYAWEVVSGTAIVIENGVAKVTRGETDDVVTLKVTVTVGEASASKEFEVTVPAIKPVSTITIAEAIVLCGTEKNVFTYDSYQIKGVVTEIANTKYGNLYIEDETGKLYIYGLYNEDGSVRFDALEKQPQVGDTITVIGVLGFYNNAQMKNGNILSIEAPSHVHTACETCGLCVAADCNGTDTEKCAGHTASSEEYVQITFDDVSKRTEFDTEHQVWEQNGIKVINEQYESTSGMGDYYNPVRFYKSSNLTIEYTANIEKIVITTALKNFSTDFTIEGCTVTVDGTSCTIVLNTPATSLTIAKLAAQVRISSIEVYPAE